MTEFQKPTKKIVNPMLMGKFQRSQGLHTLIKFISRTSGALVNTTMETPYESSKVVQSLISLLDRLDEVINMTPPEPDVPGAVRFGNPSFRIWFGKMQTVVASELSVILAGVPGSDIELGTYLSESFGNATRIDYGTGHETNFIAFCCCLDLIGVVNKNDDNAIILGFFQRYLQLIRRLQIDYRMEPAGSHGVHSLDDFQFLCFLYGSIQLGSQGELQPSDFPKADVVSAHKHKYMFLQAIDYINNVKTGPFCEHSCTLWGISGVALWDKIINGFMKMYKAEVLGKYPVMQHFYFGTLLRLEPMSHNFIRPN